MKRRIKITVTNELGEPLEFFSLWLKEEKDLERFKKELEKLTKKMEK